jgi:hypothetical protein
LEMGFCKQFAQTGLEPWFSTFQVVKIVGMRSQPRRHWGFIYTGHYIPLIRCVIC